MKRKTPEEKEKILKDIEKTGVVEGCRKYGISANTYYDWKRKYNNYGLKGLSTYNKISDKKYKNLEKENALLKKIIIEKELKIQMQEELLKKRM